MQLTDEASVGCLGFAYRPTPIQLELHGLTADAGLRAACNWLAETLDCEDWTRRMHADHCRYLLAYFGDRRVDDIRYAELIGYVRHELKRGLSKETVRKRLSTMKMAMREALAHGTLDRLPDFPVLRPQNHPRQGYWTKTQWDAANLACDGDEDFRTWVAVNWHTGMHSSDIDRFRWQDVDVVSKTWVRRNTKVKAEPKTLPLPDRLCGILRERRERLQPHPRDLVCGHPMGHPNRELRDLANRAGIPPITPTEAGRHSAETYLEECGATELFQMEWLGLKSPAMLKRHYRHATAKGMGAGIALVNVADS
jgi:integrase